MELLLARKAVGASLVPPSCTPPAHSNRNSLGLSFKLPPLLSRQVCRTKPHKKSLSSSLLSRPLPSALFRETCKVVHLGSNRRHIFLPLGPPQLLVVHASSTRHGKGKENADERLRNVATKASNKLSKVNDEGFRNVATKALNKLSKVNGKSRIVAAKALNELADSLQVGSQELPPSQDEHEHGLFANTEKVEFLRRQEYLPIQRSYRNNLCTLTLRGGASRDKVLQALAADGQTAMDAVEYGEEVISFELLFPAGNNDDGGPNPQRKGPMMMTKLMAPTDMVLDMQGVMRRQREIAKIAARRSPRQPRPQELGTRLRNRLFKQLVLEKLGDFVLRVHQPGSLVDWNTLAEPDVMCEVEGDARLGSALVATVADYALSSAARSAPSASGRRLWGAGRSRAFPSADAPVRIYTLDIDQAVASAEASRRQAAMETGQRDGEEEKEEGSGPSLLEAPVPSAWWPNPARARVSTGRARKGVRPAGGGPHFSPEQLWLDHHAEVYCLVIDMGRVVSTGERGGVSQDGVAGRSPWRERGDVGEIWEARMTHAQMVELAAALDMYQLDPASFPDKPQLQRPTLSFRQPSTGQAAKRAVSLLAGTAAVAVVVAAAAYTRFRGQSLGSPLSPTSVTALQMPSGRVKVLMPNNAELSQGEMESMCRTAVLKAAEAFYPEAMVPALESSGGSVWIGRNLSALSGSATGSEDEKQLILEYQVVLTRGGEVVGFMPANSTAVSKWALWPFASSLHGKKGPRDFGLGLFEPKLKWKGPPESAIAIHLLALHTASSTAITAKPWPI